MDMDVGQKMIIIRKNKKYGNSYCKICGKRFKKGERYFKLAGTYETMRAKMCIEHFRTIKCDENCKDRLSCLTNNYFTACIFGKNKNIRVKEINY